MRIKGTGDKSGVPSAAIQAASKVDLVAAAQAAMEEKKKSESEKGQPNFLKTSIYLPCRGTVPFMTPLGKQMLEVGFIHGYTTSMGGEDEGLGYVAENVIGIFLRSYGADENNVAMGHSRHVMLVVVHCVLVYPRQFVPLGGGRFTTICSTRWRRGTTP